MDTWKAEQPVINRLKHEIDRLRKEYRGNKSALEVLQRLQCWADEESIPPKE